MSGEKINSRGPIRPPIESGVSESPQVIHKGKIKGEGVYASATSDGVFRDVQTALEAASRAEIDRDNQLGSSINLQELIQRQRERSRREKQGNGS